jgi:type II secretory ATPase GspE/PulE/Tfp pilus assembly ATPase PilB-like protein
MRFLRKTGGVPTLPELGLRGTALKNLEAQILRPHGIILVCGPTGSGKTTTLYSILSKINSARVNILTLEDPIEYKISGINQVQINPQAGLTFANGLRSFLRQDPNVIMIGEVRDVETADLAIQAALTGHLVFSTLHTNNSAGALPRLLDMGAEPYLLASTVNCVVAQRVVRKIDTACKESFEPPKEILGQVKDILGKLYPAADGKATKLWRGKGCPACNYTGYLGRIGIFEVLVVSEKIGRLILERSPSPVLEEQSEAEGMITMKQDGFLKVLEGITTVEEVLRVAEE